MGQSSISEDPPTELAKRVDFYTAWRMVEGVSEYSATARSRAFAIWVGLFGCVDADGVVELNAGEVAAEFSVNRKSWVLYRQLLGDAGLIEQRRVESGQQRPTVMRLLPPLIES